jgi:hypothetical protein
MSVDGPAAELPLAPELPVVPLAPAAPVVPLAPAPRLAPELAVAPLAPELALVAPAPSFGLAPLDELGLVGDSVVPAVGAGLGTLSGVSTRRADP